ncbi:collagenase-like [Centruroides sculpturatus]|uniref:collagenase-like n=1 Tax=Centruroides sculpturatus TaxID=218467 RepID=UPI000C6CEC4C|nr:collagenase-like [Centruroides sculpturatus]
MIFNMITTWRNQRLLITLLLSMLNLILSENYRSHSRIIMPRMIGGTPAEEGEVPFIMAIFHRGIFKGSFSLITTTTAVGAAHVIYHSLVIYIYGAVGNINKYKGSLVFFKRKIIHLNYDPDTFENDIALLILKKSIESTPTLYPVAVADRNQTYTSGYATLAGWGRIGENTTSDLQIAVVKLADPSSWLTHFKFPLKKTEIISRDWGISAMKGDSGSPLIRRNQFGRQILIGVVSAMGQSTRVIIYMSTSFYHDFIKDNSEGEVTFL